MSNRKKFSVQERIKSFSYAWAGIKALLRTEHNAYIHLALTLVAIVLGFVLHISAGEFTALAIVITMVLVAEIFNTALEKLADFITTEKHPQVKLVKDLAAAAVLVTSIGAVVVGSIIFIPKLIYYVSIYF